MRILAVRAALAAALFAPTPVLAGTQPWTMDDILAMKVVSDPRVSPDGRWIAYVVEELKPDVSGYQTDLWLASVATGETRRLTASPGNDDSPRWSPDGASIAFLSDRPRPGSAGPAGARQVWLIPTGGGEASVLTDAAGGAAAHQWSANGAFVAFLSFEPDSAAARRKAGDGGDAWTPASRRAWSRLWTIDVATRKAARLTSGASHVTSFSIAPDGRRIAFAAQPSPRLWDAARSDLWLVPATGGAPAPLVRQAGEDQLPSFSPDGRWVAFLGQGEGHAEWWSNRQLFVVHAAGGQPASLTASFDERVEGLRQDEGARWLPDGETLLFCADTRTNRRLFRAFMDARPVDPVMKSTGVDADPDLDVNGAVLAWTHEEPTQPREVWVWDLQRGAPHPLTATNPQAAGRLAFEKQVVTWPGADGRQVEGLLVSPANARPGAKAPLLVMLHGGPDWAHLSQFTAGNRVYPYPLFAQSGWAVFLPNPRGSGGYGEAFRGANVRDWGGKDLEDVLAGVDQLVKLGRVDEKRMAVCGWSYGGFLAASIVTKTDRFRAAVVGAGIADLAAMLGSDAPEFTRTYMGAWPWEDPQAWVARSPLYQAGNVKTPTAFLHGAADERVPPGQVFAFWQALEQRGVPTDLLVLPREPHIPFEPRHQKAAMQWHWDWITKWTLNPPAAAPAARGANRGSR